MYEQDREAQDLAHSGTRMQVMRQGLPASEASSEAEVPALRHGASEPSSRLAAPPRWQRSPANDDVDRFLRRNKPHWSYLGKTTSQERLYHWHPDPKDENYVHINATGSGEHGTSASAVDLLKMKSRTNRCERSHERADAECPHCGASRQGAGVPVKALPQSYAPGQQVGYRGQGYYVTDFLHMDGQPHYELANEQGETLPRLIPHKEVTPWPIPDAPSTPGAPPTSEPPHVASILDPIHATLDPLVFDNPAAPEPTPRYELVTWITNTIFEVFDRHGYDHPEAWLTLVLTGSLTTYQYSDGSDCDINLFVDAQRLPDWSRAELVALVVNNIDGMPLPGTPHPMQCFVIPPGISTKDKFRPGLRSGFELWQAGKATMRWLVPPERERVHDVETEMHDAYEVGLLSADKLDLLMRFEPEQAQMYWTDLHNKRRTDQEAGLGDSATSNIVWKMVSNRFGEHPFSPHTE